MSTRKMIVRVLKSGEVVTQTESSERSLVFGRSQDCDVRVDDPAVSRRHVRMVLADDGVAVEKISDFGVLQYEGAEITSVVIPSGGRVQIGVYELEVSWEGAAAPSEMPVQDSSYEDLGLDVAPVPIADIVAQVAPALEAAPAPAEEQQAKPPLDEIAIDIDDGGLEIETFASAAPVTPPESPAESSPESPLALGDEPTAILSDTEVRELDLDAQPAPAESTNAEPPPLEEPKSSINLENLEELSGDSAIKEVSAPAITLASLLKADSGGPVEISSPLGSGASSGGDLAFTPIKGKTGPASTLGMPQQELPAEAFQNTGASGPSSSGTAVGGTEAKTRVTANSRVRMCLVFKSGEANVTEYEIRTAEVVIGRSQSCDIVIEDKKSSRRNTAIRRDGLRFWIRDLDSVNGTFVNDERITERELNGDDRIRIGDTEFEFKVFQVAYESREADFPAVRTSTFSQTRASGQGFGQAIGKTLTRGYVPPSANDPLAPPPWQGGIPAGVTGGKPPVGLLAKFRAMPPKRRILVVLVVFTAIWIGLDEMGPKGTGSKTPQQKKEAAVTKTFDSLTAKEKEFVERQYTLGFDLYRNQKYDESLFELRQIFKLLNDYRDARDIERYALKGQEILAQKQAEKRKAEDEEKIRSQVDELLVEVDQAMAQSDFEKAIALFSQVLKLDPENEKIAKYQAAIEAYQSQRKLENEQALAKAEINKNATVILREGARLAAQDQCHAAVKKYRSVLEELGVSDPKLLSKAKAGIQSCRDRVLAAVTPILGQATEAEGAGQIQEAFGLYRKAAAIDPGNSQALKGMNRLRGTMTEMARALYTEAVLAESLSDFDDAKGKYEQTLKLVPEDDIYHQRARRKLSRFTGLMDRTDMGADTRANTGADKVGN